MLTLYDAARCPFCARVRIALAEKQIPHEVVAVDLEHRPAFIVELNPPRGRVPVLEDDGFVLPESEVILQYLDERYPEVALLPADPGERALARLRLHRFDDELGRVYYDVRWNRAEGSADRLAEALGRLDGRLQDGGFLAGVAYSIADIAYVPWILRAERQLGVDLSPFQALSAWLGRLLERPAVAAEADVVAHL